MTQLTEQEIAKELLQPYFDDPTLCSVSEDGDTCVYNGPDGRMCVFAKACTPEGRELLKEDSNANEQLMEHGLGVLQDKYRHIEDGEFWDNLQYCHDELARDKVRRAKTYYENLTKEYQ